MARKRKKRKKLEVRKPRKRPLGLLGLPVVDAPKDEKPDVGIPSEWQDVDSILTDAERMAQDE
jgi:hypothetical protein